MINIGVLQLKRDKTIKKRNYDNPKEYHYDAKTERVPNKKDRLICIFFSEEKGCHIIFRKMNAKSNCFRFRKGLYIIDNESIHVTKNGSRVAFYLESISTPIKMSNIEKQVETIDYTDLYGNKQKSTVTKIKGLKFDSKIFDTFANERFAEIFTKQKIDNLQLILLILGIISLVMIGISYGIIYYFR